MRYYTHIVAAILFLLLLDYLFEIRNEDLIIGILITSIVAVMPDLVDMILDSGHRAFGHSLLLWIPIIIAILIISIFKGNLVILAAVITGIVSHFILDLVTKHGIPFLYPIKTNIVALNDKRRIKTGTRGDKAVFIFLILLLIPALAFSFEIIPLAAPQVQAQEPPNNTITNHTEIKDNINVNIDSRMKNRNITIKKVTENETQILVQDLTK